MVGTDGITWSVHPVPAIPLPVRVCGIGKNPIRVKTSKDGFNASPRPLERAGARRYNIGIGRGFISAESVVF